jgi:hypothetical protein
MRAVLETKKSAILSADLHALTTQQTIDFIQLVNVHVDETKLKDSNITAAALSQASHGLAGIMHLTRATAGHAEYLRQALVKLHSAEMIAPRRRFLDPAPLTRPLVVGQWSTQVTCQWLAEVGLGALQPLFMSQDIDGQVLLTMNFVELTALEPKLEALIDSLEKQIQALRS